MEVELFGAGGGAVGGGRGLGGHASSGWETAGAAQSLNRSTALLEDSMRTIAATEEVRRRCHAVLGAKVLLPWII